MDRQVRGLRRVVVGVVGCALLALGIGPIRPDGAAQIPPISDASLQIQQWLTREMPEAYEREGHHDAKWDVAARETMKLSVDLWGSPRTRGVGNWGHYQAARKAVEAGCDDPIVLYAYARTFHTFGHDAVECMRLHERAAAGLLMSHYSGYYKCLAQFRLTELKMDVAHDTARTTGKYDPAEFKAASDQAVIAIGLFKAVAADRDLPVSRWIDLGDAASEAFDFGSGRKYLIETALPRLDALAPKAAALAIKGTFYTHYAWDARGSDFANTVTKDGWRLMGERLETAQAALEEAWKLDPTCATIAARMITVELGQDQGRDRMELWFKRAMAADPDNIEACENKLTYLEPKWHGSPRELIAFGHECLKTGRFNSDVPGMLERAHEALSHYGPGGYGASNPVYFHIPGVWADVKQVYDGYLLADKDVDCTWLRNKYAEMACRCGAWDDAAKMFAQLGDHSDPRVWTPEVFEAARKEASEQAGK